MRIKRVRHIGTGRTYSIEMAGDQHNFITADSGAVHRNSHAVSYCLVAYRCLWLKAHFAPEWWAAVMSRCHPDKLVRYISVARGEGWKPTDITKIGTNTPDTGIEFNAIDVENLTMEFTVSGNTISQGMVSINGIGDSTAKQWSGRTKFTTLDKFVEEKGKNKRIMEAFIKLGAFRRFPGYENAKATWIYYQYKYCTGKDITKLRKEINAKLLEAEGWTEEKIEQERQRQIDAYKKLYPNRNVIPKKILNWKPKPDNSAEKVIVLFKDDDFTIDEILEFEKHYLGYYLHSPLDAYEHDGAYTIANAKQTPGGAILEVVVMKYETQLTKHGDEYARVIVTDGVVDALVLIFPRELSEMLESTGQLNEGDGVNMVVEYDSMRGTFSVRRNEPIVKLRRKNAIAK